MYSKRAIRFCFLVLLRFLSEFTKKKLNFFFVTSEEVSVQFHSILSGINIKIYIYIYACIFGNLAIDARKEDCETEKLREEERKKREIFVV